VAGCDFRLPQTLATFEISDVLRDTSPTYIDFELSDMGQRTCKPLQKLITHWKFLIDHPVVFLQFCPSSQGSDTGSNPVGTTTFSLASLIDLIRHSDSSAEPFTLLRRSARCKGFMETG
jgi:hypothetical protein